MGETGRAPLPVCSVFPSLWSLAESDYQVLPCEICYICPWALSQSKPESRGGLGSDNLDNKQPLSHTSENLISY